MSEGKTTGILAGGLGLLCVISLGANYYLFNDRASVQNELEKALNEKRPASEQVMPRPPRRLDSSAEGGSAAEIEELNAYINQLQNQIAQMQERLANANQQGSRRGGPGGGQGMGRGGRGNMQEMMERMKEEDPERYEQMMQRRQEMEKRMDEAMAKRTNFFQNIDTSRLSASQRNTISNYQDLLSQSQEMMTSMRNGEQVDFRQMGEVMRGMGEITTEVQDILFSQLGGNNLAESVREILEVTGNGMGGGFGGPMGGGPGRGPMGGGPGRGPGRR